MMTTEQRIAIYTDCRPGQPGYDETTLRAAIDAYRSLRKSRKTMKAAHTAVSERFTWDYATAAQNIVEAK